MCFGNEVKPLSIISQGATKREQEVWENDCCGKALKCVRHNKTKEKNDNFTPRPTKIAPHIFNTGTC